MSEPEIDTEEVEELTRGDLCDLCDAAEAAITEGGGFGWVETPNREAMERYWQGVLVVPGRSLFVGRLDGVISGTAQLKRPPRANEAQAHAANLVSAFVAPWARGHGLGRAMVLAIEETARAEGFHILNLDVRETQTAAIQLYESMGYECWGTHPSYAMVHDRLVPGRFYYKTLRTAIRGVLGGGVPGGVKPA